MKQIEVAIVGAGTAGITARNVVAKHTDNYRVIDPGPLGTLCARAGCMPSKVLIHVANHYAQVRQPPPGLQRDKNLAIDSKQVMQHVRKLRDRFVTAVLRDMEAWQDQHLISRRARFVDPNTLDLEGDRLRAKRIIIATGSQPVIPTPWVPFKDNLLTSDNLFELEQLPGRVVVLGLGPLGIELSLALQQLGVETVAVDPSRNIGRLTDPGLVDIVSDYFAGTMDICFEPAKIESANAKSAVVVAADRRIVTDRVLVAVGRTPVIADLGLENLGVPLAASGLPPVNPATLQIAGLPVFMAGDANAIRPLLHEAANEGRIAGHNAAQSSPRDYDRMVPLSISFCSPQIALAGQTFNELQESDVQFVTGKADFANEGRALIMDSASAHIRIYAARQGGQVLGAELFSPGAEHLAHLVAWAIAQKLSVGDLLRMPYYHPVLEEGLRGAISAANRLVQG